MGNGCLTLMQKIWQTNCKSRYLKYFFFLFWLSNFFNQSHFSYICIGIQEILDHDSMKQTYIQEILNDSVHRDSKITTYFDAYISSAFLTFDVSQIICFSLCAGFLRCFPYFSLTQTKTLRASSGG